MTDKDKKKPKEKPLNIKKIREDDARIERLAQKSRKKLTEAEKKAEGKK